MQNTERPKVQIIWAKDRMLAAWLIMFSLIDTYTTPSAGNLLHKPNELYPFDDAHIAKFQDMHRSGLTKVQDMVDLTEEEMLQLKAISSAAYFFYNEHRRYDKTNPFVQMHERLFGDQHLS